MKGFKAVNILLSFVLSIFLFLASTLGALYFSFFNEDKVLNMFISEEYISSSYADFMNSMEALSTPSYIAEECYNRIFSKDRYEKDLKKFFSETFKTGEFYDLSSDTGDMIEVLEKNISLYGEENGIEITDAIRENISEFSLQSVEKYKKYISVNYVQYYSKICSRFEQWVLIGSVGAVCITLLSILILFKSRYEDHDTVYNYLSYSFSAGALLTCILPFYSLFTGLYKNINIRPEYIYNIIRALLLSIQNAFFAFSGVLLILGIVFAIIASLKLRRREDESE